jgi:hypothetical protein
MPAIMIEKVVFDKGLCINLRYLYQMLPFIREGGDLGFYIIEIDNNRLVKRFKPMMKLKIKLEQCYDQALVAWIPCIKFSEKDALNLNLATNYDIAILITDYNGEPIFPFEIRALGYGSEKIAGTLSEIEGRLISLIVKNNILNEAVSYLLDSYLRLEENDIEGARTSLRNAVQIVRDKFIKSMKLKDLEENKKYLKNLRKLTSILSGFLSYGGPHPGPAPRMTTEMVIEVVADIIEYLARCLENKMIEVVE